LETRKVTRKVANFASRILRRPATKTAKCFAFRRECSTRLGAMQMALGQTPPAIESFEKARTLQGDAFRNQLELGVLYLAARRFSEAREALDRVARNAPAYPMALFKRAQVSVLLHEPDAPARIEAARRYADATTREMIARERLFQ
jgi:tetratricopeptide (TPR) repeat protein